MDEYESGFGPMAGSCEGSIENSNVIKTNNSSTSLATTVLYEHARRIYLNVLRSVSHMVLHDHFNVCHFWIFRLGARFPPAIYGLHYLETPSPPSNTFLYFAIQGV